MSHRYSLANFQLYAPFIGLALKRLPSTLIVDPGTALVPSVSQETFAARLRDARAAKLLYAFVHKDIDEMLFLQKAKNLSVRMLPNGKVEIYDRTAKEKTAVPVNPEFDHELIEFLWNDTTELVALAGLVSRKQFRPPIPFLVHKITDEHKQHLNNFDIELVQHGADSYIIL